MGTDIQLREQLAGLLMGLDELRHDLNQMKEGLDLLWNQKQPYWEDSTARRAFDITIKGTEATIEPGTLIVPGDGFWHSGETTVTIGGSTTCWVYCKHKANHSDGLTVVANTINSFPVSTDSEFALALWELEKKGSKWRVKRACLAGSDIVLR